MIDYVNQKHAYHIVTVEDPIEYTFRDKRSVINQREVGFDTMTFGRALRAALRQDPDVILVGEMRDQETAQIAITAAETGHLVLSTLHTVNATETINRIISMYPTHQQAQARLSLGAVLRGVISQRLLPRADGKGMVPAIELMVNTERVREMIEDPNRTREIKDAIAEGLHPYGMVSFDQSLANLVKQKFVTYDEAIKHSSSPSDFALQFRGVSGGSLSLPTGGAGGSADANPGAFGHDDFEIDRFGK
jgi:twitching motility protein PilT